MTDKTGPAFYVASRASIPARSEMWRDLRSRGMNIVSSWIDEAGEGETESFEELWQRIYREIQSSTALILYAEQGDFPLKGALIEVGIALGMGKPVMLSLPGVVLEGRTYKPLGSWIEHPGVTRLSTSLEAFCYKTPAPNHLASLPVGESTEDLHSIICQAVELLNQGDTLKAHTLLRQTLAEYVEPVGESRWMEETTREKKNSLILKADSLLHVVMDKDGLGLEEARQIAADAHAAVHALAGILSDDPEIRKVAANEGPGENREPLPCHICGTILDPNWLNSKCEGESHTSKIDKFPSVPAEVESREFLKEKE